MNALDYYQNPAIIKTINQHLRHIKNECDREDCRQEVFAELYNMMPLDEREAIKLVNSVSIKFRRDIDTIQSNELSLDEMLERGAII